MKLFEFKPKLVSCLKNYSKETFMADLMAGVIVGIVALPLAIAFGIASGVSPEKGIITAIIAGFIISLMGGSKVQVYSNSERSSSLFRIPSLSVSPVVSPLLFSLRRSPISSDCPSEVKRYRGILSGNG